MKRIQKGPLAGLVAAMMVVLALIGPIFGDGGQATGAAIAEREVREYLSSREGDYGVALLDLDEGRAASVDGHKRFQTASMYKLFVMYEVMRAVEEGRLSLTQSVKITSADAVEGEPRNGLGPGATVTVSEALEKMIAVSSNAAAYALARSVGGWDEIRGVPFELGLKDTGFDEYWWSTPADILHFYKLMAEGKLVNRKASDDMIALLEKQTLDDRIPARLPDSVTVAHKTGELDGVRNDGGIVTAPEARYILVVMSKDAAPDVATESVAEVSRIVYASLANDGASTVRAQSG